MIKTNQKILIITGGNVSKLDAFKPAIEKLKLDVTLASFSDINYNNIQTDYKKSSNMSLMLNDVDVSVYDLIYIRMIGKRLEDATLLVNYARKNNIRIVDRLYETELLYPSSISKAVETKKLMGAGVSMPPSFYGKLSYVMELGRNEFGFPFCIKSTSGRKAREVWIVENEAEYSTKLMELTEMEKAGMRFFAQKYIKASQRVRVMVLGGMAFAATTRPTKWRNKIDSTITRANPEGIKGKVELLPIEYKIISEKAANAVSLDVCGVDILHEDDTNNIYVIEANAAPAWKLIEKDWQIDMEEEILKWLISSNNSK